MSKRQVSEAQRWQIIGLLKGNTKSQQEKADLVGVSRKCVFTTKCNYEKTTGTKELFVKRFTYEKYHPKFCLPKLQNGKGSVAELRMYKSSMHWG
ncbi:unnamed protein product [Brachionus calyciflorus]|uniref:Uncharacterized protein n=1 Tax=Brachionus calyciflorus TaxID=104777 RepID=A0A814K0Z9_9BILA|nr:unnamed protein product [Brachionus calyciflorus]